MKKKSAFTLLELLVVIAIIVILGALLFPVINKTLEKGRDIRCQANLKSLWRGAMNYVNYNPEHSLPQYWVCTNAAATTSNWRGPAAITSITNSTLLSGLKGYRWSDTALTVTTTNPVTGLVTVNRSLVLPTLYTFVDSDIRVYLCPTFARQAKTLSGVNDAYRNYLMNTALQGADYLMITNSVRLPVFSESFMVANPGPMYFTTTNSVELTRYHGGKRIGVTFTNWNGSANIIFMDGHVGKL